MLDAIRDNNLLVVRLPSLSEDSWNDLWDEPTLSELLIVGASSRFGIKENPESVLLREDPDSLEEKCALKEFLLESLELGMFWCSEGNWWLVDDVFNCKVLNEFSFGLAPCEYEGTLSWASIFERKKSNQLHKISL